MTKPERWSDEWIDAMLDALRSQRKGSISVPVMLRYDIRTLARAVAREAFEECASMLEPWPTSYGDAALAIRARAREITGDK